VGAVVAGSVSLEFTNKPQWDAALKAALDQWMRQVGVNAEDLGTLAVSEARVRAPVDTGRLRRGISSRVESDSNGWSLIFYNDVIYAVFQEFGTRKMRARPHMRPGLAAAINQYTRMMLRGMK